MDALLKTSEILSAETVMDSLSDGVYVTDLERRIVYWSPAAERITGWSAKDVVGRCCRDQILCHVDKDGRQLCGEEHCPLFRSMTTGERTTVPIIVFGQGKDGTRIPMHVSVSPLRNETGQVMGAVEVFRDLGPRMYDLERARTLQASVVVNDIQDDPRIHLEVSYSPKDIVGGDFYSLKSIDHDRIAIFQADAMGHGIAAALYTMFFRLLWVELSDMVCDPAAFLSAVNERVHPLVGTGDIFATAMAAVVDLAEGTVCFSGAGHPSPILFRGSGETEFLDCSGVPLGLLPRGSYPKHSARFGPGDSLLIHTDGALEIENKLGVELGQEGLSGMVEQLLNHGDGVSLPALEELLLRYSNDIRLQDDLTLIWLARHA